MVMSQLHPSEPSKRQEPGSTKAGQKIREIAENKPSYTYLMITSPFFFSFVFLIHSIV